MFNKFFKKKEKENFFELLKLMQYKQKKVDDEKKECFEYQPKYIKKKHTTKSKKINETSPFDKLSELRFR